MKQGRDDEAGVINMSHAEHDEPNPFDWVHAGQEAYDNGESPRIVKANR